MVVHTFFFGFILPSGTKGIFLFYFSFNSVLALSLFLLLDLYLTISLLHIGIVLLFLTLRFELEIPGVLPHLVFLSCFTIQLRTRVLDLFASVAESTRISKPLPIRHLFSYPAPHLRIRR